MLRNFSSPVYFDEIADVTDHNFGFYSFDALHFVSTTYRYTYCFHVGCAQAIWIWT